MSKKKPFNKSWLPTGFQPRHWILRGLEGWYTIGRTKIKFSCRFKDIKRCSYFPEGKPVHFHSCYAPRGSYSDRPDNFCFRNNWAIVYYPDKHGNFQGRYFVEFGWEKFFIPTLVFHNRYGNSIPNWWELVPLLKKRYWWAKFIRYRSSPRDVHFRLY